MSSVVYLEPNHPISRKSFDEFASKNEIEFSPDTIGGNVYYYGGLGGVEISFEERSITVSSFFCENLLSIAFIAKKILDRFNCTYNCSPELKCYLPPKYLAEEEKT